MNDFPIKAILVDDEPRGLTALQKLLEQNCPGVDVLATCTDGHTAKDVIYKLKPQLVFLDISMPGMSGFDLLDELSPVSFETVFITAHSSYAANAFKYSATDYLLKPVDENLLITAVNRVSRNLQLKLNSNNARTLTSGMPTMITQRSAKLCIPSLKGFNIIDVADVIYCEAANSYTTFHLSNGNHIISSKPIIDYELLLQDNEFFRIHKSFLVNLTHVKEYVRGEGGHVILSNDKYVEVSRRKKESFINRIKDLFKY